MPNKSINNSSNNARKPSTTAGNDAGRQDDTGNKPKASGHGGKVENDFNQVGEQKPTQRTANSRNDRESHVGGSNQLRSRRGSGGNGGH